MFSVQDQKNPQTLAVYSGLQQRLTRLHPHVRTSQYQAVLCRGYPGCGGKAQNVCVIIFFDACRIFPVSLVPALVSD